MENHEPLLRHLRRGYTTFRLRRIAESAGLGAAVFLPSLLAAITVGLLLRRSTIANWIVPVLAAGGLAGGVFRAVRFGIRHHLSFGAFVLQIEEQAGFKRNELVNALQLGRASASMKDPLAKEIAFEVLRRGLEAARRIQFRALAPARNMRLPLGSAALSLIVLGIIFVFAPVAAMRSADRIFHPGGNQGSESAQILVQPGDCTAQRGADLSIRVRLVGLDGLPVLFHRTGGGAWQRETMQSDSVGFMTTMHDLQASTEYAATVGGTRSRTYRISLEEPLRATGYEKRTSYPAYSGLAPEKELSPHASIAALKGSQVELRVHLSRPDARGRLVFESGGTIPLDSVGPSVASASITVRLPEIFRVELESPEVQGARWRSEPFRSDPIPDRDPNIYLVSPAEQSNIPPDMSVSLIVDCADDFGITRLDLVSKRNDGSPTRATISRWTTGREARVEYPWDLETVALVPGDRISYHLELADNDAVSGPKVTISPEYILRFPTVDEMYAQQTEERHEGIEDLRESLDKQIELRQELDKITRDIRQDSGVQWEQKQEVEDVLKKQEEILQKMENITSGMDRQIQRVQQGQLFSPEIVAKIAQIQSMMQQIQSPEFHKMIEQMRQAMQSLDPQAVKKAIEQMKLTQKDLEQGLDRTLQMLERLLAEEKLNEMIQRAQRLQEKQDQINQELSRSEDGQRPDSTTALSPEQTEKLKAEQAAAQKELEDLKKQMQELREMAQKSHPQMSERLEGQKGQQAKQDLDKSSENMESGKQCMGKSNRSGALKSGRKTSKGLQSFSQQMQQMQSEMQASMTEEMSRKLLGLAGDLVELSRAQEDANSRANRDNTRELALEQDRISRAAAAVVDQIYELARQTPFISPSQARALGDALNSLAKATDGYELGQRGLALVQGQRAETMMDAAVASLLESNQSMCNSASSSCNKPNPFSQMQGISSQQQGLNGETQQTMGEMSGGSRMQEGGEGRLERLAAQQMQIRQGLMELSQSMGGGEQNLLGRLDDLAKEMEEVAKEMKERHLDQRVIQRQEKILSRLLTAQRSLRRQDFEEQRRSRTGVDPSNPTSPAGVQTGLSRREEIKRGILKGSQDPIPGDFRRIVDEYFKALTGDVEPADGGSK
jgi:hypothetical protein